MILRIGSKNLMEKIFTARSIFQPSSLRSSYQQENANMEDYYEWRYVMRRTMQEIIPGLYLGPYSSAVKSNLPALLEAGITHIICVRQNVEAALIKPHFPDRFQYLILDIADSKTENILKHFAVSNDFIERCLSGGGRCLVHGNAGISRSATLVVAYVMQKLDLPFLKTFRLVQKRRFCVGPNEGFMAQLSEFEPIYKASREMQHDSRQKRKFEEVEPAAYVEMDRRDFPHFPDYD